MFNALQARLESARKGPEAAAQSLEEGKPIASAPEASVLKPGALEALAPMAAAPKTAAALSREVQVARRLTSAEATAALEALNTSAAAIRKCGPVRDDYTYLMTRAHLKGIADALQTLAVNLK